MPGNPTGAIDRIRISRPVVRILVSLSTMVPVACMSDAAFAYVPTIHDGDCWNLDRDFWCRQNWSGTGTETKIYLRDLTDRASTYFVGVKNAGASWTNYSSGSPVTLSHVVSPDQSTIQYRVDLATAAGRPAMIGQPHITVSMALLTGALPRKSN